MNRRHIVGIFSGALLLAGTAVSALAEEPSSAPHRIPQTAVTEYHDKLQEWSKGLGVSLPLAGDHVATVTRGATVEEESSSVALPIHRIPQTAVTEHRDKLQEWSRGLGVTLHDL